MHAAIESPNQADVIALIAELDAYQDTLYPAEARYALCRGAGSLRYGCGLWAVARWCCVMALLKSSVCMCRRERGGKGWRGALFRHWKPRFPLRVIRS